jgi:NADPH-dependent glutamate synthase beta subunit-like oxidoreductase
VVVIAGGAVSGSEAAAVCAQRGILAIVIEQNVRPYGKIEDGLPRWHDKLRRKEYGLIDANLDRPEVVFVPKTLIGRDLAFSELHDAPGVSAMLLANGAWRDRPLGLPGVDAYVGRGLVYQNPFVYWFNHAEDPTYDGPRYEVVDGAMVVGGGLASIDVIKILNLELYRNALANRGIRVSIVELEHAGIPKTLADHKLTKEELGIQGATLYYRRRVRDMPIAFPKDESPEQRAKTEVVREKMVNILAQKYLVRVADCHAATAPIIEGDRLVGLRFRKTEQRDGKLVEVPGSETDVRAPLIVSSIGSVPEPMPGVPTKGELYDYTDWNTGALRGLRGVYGLGNVLTGKGNIKDSRDNARDVSQRTLEGYLGIGSMPPENVLDETHEQRRAAAERVIEDALRITPARPADIRGLIERMAARWREVGYSGDYKAWIAAHPPDVGAAPH